MKEMRERKGRRREGGRENEDGEREKERGREGGRENEDGEKGRRECSIVC